MFNLRLAKLQKTVEHVVQSRVHRLKFHPECFVKRDDELGFGISGSKIRKYQTLIPFFVNANVKEVVVIGSAFSNHVVGIIQLLIENNIQATLFLRGDKSRSKQGNSLLTSLFVEEDSIHWFSKEDWKDVNEKAKQYAQSKSHHTFVLPEGGTIAEALPGALTLPLDILRNEVELNAPFDHIFIDSGTGLMAIAVILGMAWLKRATTIHVVLMAGDEEYFHKKLREYLGYFNTLLKEEMPFPDNFRLHLPILAFGKVNEKVFDSIRHMARTEGFLVDPIYTAKLFMEGEKLVKQLQLRGRILFNHSGGALTLMGFQKEL